MKFAILLSFILIFPSFVGATNIDCMEGEISLENDMTRCISKIFDQAVYLRETYVSLLIESSKLNHARQDINYLLRAEVSSMIGDLEIRLRELQSSKN